jgi:type I restriction enzyme, R subunit
VRSSQSWLDAALQVHDDYERNVPELFVPNVFSVATEGKEFRYGSVRMPVDLWGPWRDGDGKQTLGGVEEAASTMLRPGMVLDLLDSFTAFATQKGKQRMKIIARYQQVDGVNKIVARISFAQPVQFKTPWPVARDLKPCAAFSKVGATGSAMNTVVWPI